MKSIIDLQKRLLPDLLSIIQKRYHILHIIGSMEPVGRRTLSVTLDLTERVLRSEVDFLKQQKLIYSTSSGMSLTEDGKELVEELGSVIRDITGIDEMESGLQQSLGIKKVFIVSGNSDLLPWVKEELGKTCVTCINKYLSGKNIIAVTGGSTMASIADMMKPYSNNLDLLFVPARGGIGEDVKNQANSICSKMAERTRSKHRVLYVPDQVSKEMYEFMIKEPEIHEVLSLIKSASMVLHGIGDAITMANRRKTNEEELKKLKESKAVGEAFGYYFNEAGEVVHKVQTVGLQLDDLRNVKHVIAVAGGASKAKAIRAYMKQAPPSTILITDEAAAQELLQGKSL
ncbi:sugar-binding domain-containing protein [Bacillus sp. V3B]|uniref:sugar-binding transcriptional regulator n=1 Tax=Bacillus sp. V3B TaxID=2804915 RepID=UPI00210B0352|nr:sugar-binding domain-containing protein [Bacillus sp. V3B]MCQ6275682.1 sugar-binding domain-containing protein [Bacillus sp. V3B]